MTLIEAVRLLKKQRPFVLANTGYRLALVRRARALGRLAGPEEMAEDLDELT